MAWKFLHRKQDHPSDWSGFIEHGVKLEGKLDFPATFRLNGSAKGNIRSEQILILGDAAVVEGQIEGRIVVIAGRFQGAIYAKERVQIQPGAAVSGEIHAPCLVIEPGGIFDGQCYMTSSTADAQTISIPVRSSQPD